MELSSGIHLSFIHPLAKLAPIRRPEASGGPLFLLPRLYAMSSRSLLLIPVLGLVGLLSACAGPMPKADPSEAWIGLQEEPSAVLMAEDLDGKRLNDGRYFEVSPGAHRLGLSLIVEADGDNNEERCTAHINYQQFKAGSHYKVVESSLGEDYSAVLEDSSGKELGHSHDFDCMPG